MPDRSEGSNETPPKNDSPAGTSGPAPSDEIRRMFSYNRKLLPNDYVAELELQSPGIDEAVERTGLSIGYPAWNLLYYSLLCSIRNVRPVVVETGTNVGFSTIMMAQALKDSGAQAAVRTVDIDPEVVKWAMENVRLAQLEQFVSFTVSDSLAFLREITASTDRIDFAFLDGSHEAQHVIAEFELIHAQVAASRGKIYFDNTSAGGVAEALAHIRKKHGGSLVEFDNCSWFPPGNAIWQA